MFEEIKKLLKHSSVYSLGNILNKGVAFLLIPFYTHYLTTANYGILELLDLSVTLVGLLLNVWMNASLVRHYYDYEDAGNRNEVVSTALIATGAAAAGCSAFGFLWARGISMWILKSPEFYISVRLVAGSLFFTCVNSVCISYLRARQQSSRVVMTNIASLVIGLVLNIYFLAVVKLGIIGILASGLVSSGLVTTMLTVVTVKQVGIHFEWSKLRAIVAFGLPLIISSVSAFELNFGDRLFLQHYSSVSTIGIYALGYKFGYMLSFLLIQPFIMIWGARMYEIAKQPNGEAVFARILPHFALVMSTVGLAISLLIKDVISVIAAPQFRQAYTVVPTVALAYVFYGLSYYFQTGLYISKKTAYLGLMGALSAGANVGLNLLLIPRFAAMGAAWATAISFLLMAVLAYVFSQRVYHISYPVLKTVLPVVAAMGVYTLSSLIEFSSILLSIMTKISLLIGFWVIALACGFLEPSETLRLRQFARNAAGRIAWISSALERTNS